MYPKGLPRRKSLPSTSSGQASQSHMVSGRHRSNIFYVEVTLKKEKKSLDDEVYTLEKERDDLEKEIKDLKKERDDLE